MSKKKKYPEGYFAGLGIVFGMFIFGFPLSIALDNFAFIGAGLPLGLAVGLALEEKYKRKGMIKTKKIKKF